MADADDKARNRYFIIQALRIVGVAMVVAGIAMVRGKFGGEPLVGYVLIVIGLLDTFGTPVLLARKWRTPRP